MHHIYIHFLNARRGVTLLLMIVLLAAFLSISLGIINILLGELVVVGQAGESFDALYAADTGIERTLYRTRAATPLCTALDCNESRNVSSGGCYEVNVVIAPDPSCLSPLTRCMEVMGKNRCGGAERYVTRKFDVRY